MKNDDDWVSVALTDDTAVVDLLFRLKHHLDSSQSSHLYTTTTQTPPPTTTTTKDLNLPLPPNGWGHRQRRSKQFTSVRKESTRWSPTTPLSWSGGVSLSDDESSRQFSSDLSSSGFRSKGLFTNETNYFVSSSSSKRSRKNKTFDELKDEEDLLMKERVHLKRELSSIRVTLKEQRVRSENFKRIKFDLNLQSTNDMARASASNQCNLLKPSRTNHAHSVLTRRHTMDDNPLSSDSSRVKKFIETQKRCFVLPDLNMTPSAEEIGSTWN